MIRQYIITLLALPSLMFLSKCTPDKTGENPLTLKEQQRIITSFSGQIADDSPTKSHSVEIVSLLYSKIQNDSIEGEIIKVFEEVEKEKQMVKLIEELNYPADSGSVLEDLFFRWDKVFVTGEWVDSEETVNQFYLYHLLIPIMKSSDLDENNTKIIFTALNNRYSHEGEYSIYIQNLITSVVAEIKLENLNQDVKEVIKEAITDHKGKKSSNGQINLLREQLGLPRYK